MKTAVVTGSARGFGLELLRCFYKEGLNVVISDVNENSIEEAVKDLTSSSHSGMVLSYTADVTDPESLDAMIQDVVKKTGSIDIWINNAGVNQPDDYIWDIDEKTINRLIDINLKGDILATKAILPYMRKQGSGQIYFVEGFGYDGKARPKLALYGTSKRGVNFFIDALAMEVKESGDPIVVGSLIPGIMITNFIHTTLGDGESIDIPEKTKKVYNILGDYPSTIAEFMVPKILANTKPAPKFRWLTTMRAMKRFMTASKNKRDFFTQE